MNTVAPESIGLSASHLIAEGIVEEGLTIVETVRSLYDGHTRNPWNEYERGSYYARVMSSYALLIALSGFRYSAPTRTLIIDRAFALNPSYLSSQPPLGGEHSRYSRTVSRSDL